MVERLLYNILFPVFLVLSSPWYLNRLIKRGNWKRGFWERFGFYPKTTIESLRGKNVIWIHAVSVGEVNIALQLLKQLQRVLPGMTFVLSTTTTTGREVLHRNATAQMVAIYYPIDLLFSVKRALRTINPMAIIIMEAEIWPNLIWQATDRKIPIFLANARLSERSYKRYRFLRRFFCKVFDCFTLVFAQNQADVSRLCSLGIRPEKIYVVGSLKFDTVQLDAPVPVELSTIMEHLTSNRLVLLGGSTHPGEERILAEIYLSLRKSFPDLFLILVPRHFERAPQVAAELKSLDIKYVLRSTLNPKAMPVQPNLDCLLVDTTGELRHLYKFATVVFVGKTLTSHGGQNPIEPAAVGKPIVFGPNMENFEQIAHAFLTAGAAIQVRNKTELEFAIRMLLNDPNKRAEIGSAARNVVSTNQGATFKTAQAIAAILTRQLSIQHN